MAKSSYWSLPVRRYLSDSRCKGSVVILARWTIRAVWPRSRRRLLVTKRQRWTTSGSFDWLPHLTRGLYTVSSRRESRYFVVAHVSHPYWHNVCLIEASLGFQPDTWLPDSPLQHIHARSSYANPTQPSPLLPPEESICIPDKQMHQPLQHGILLRRENLRYR